MESKWGFAVWHRELNPVLCDSREGSDWEADMRGFRKEVTHGYLCLSHVVIGRNEHNM